MPVNMLRGLATVTAALALTGTASGYVLPAYPTPVPSECATADEWQRMAGMALGNRAFTVFEDGLPQRIVFSPQTCLGLLLLSLDPAGRHDQLNPGTNVPWLEGEAALAYMHETGHATLRTTDETAAECFGLTHYRSLLVAVPADRRLIMEAAAIQSDAGQPAAYHARPC